MDTRIEVPKGATGGGQWRSAGEPWLSFTAGAQQRHLKAVVLLILILLWKGGTGTCTPGVTPRQHSPIHHKVESSKLPPPPTYKDERYVNYNMEQIDDVVTTNRSRGRRAATTLDFICPSSRCKEKDCVIAWRELQKGHWEWVTNNRANVTVHAVQDLPGIKLVRYQPQNLDVENLELWCFKRHQLTKQLNCLEWEINYPPGKQKLTTCAGTSHLQGQNIEIMTDLDGKLTNSNSAMGLVIDYARERNFSNCWLCQHMPKSTHSSALTPVPFSKADYIQHNWNDLAYRMQNHSDDCYSPSSPVELSQDEKYKGLANIVIDQVNSHYLPPGINITTLLRITYVQLFTKLGFEYRIQLTLTQTNCSTMGKSLRCVPQPYTPAVLVEALVSVLPWIGMRSVDEVKVKILNCEKPLQAEVSNLRDCSQYIPPIAVEELTNIPICFQGAGTDPKKDVGHSQCSHSVMVGIRQIPLPERVYMVCGGKAYRCMPYDTFRGTCYLAYLIPMIRRVATSEIAALYAPLHRQKRTITKAEKVFGVLVPAYGVYVTQQEVTSLSKVLEVHLNASARAMLAEHKELSEVKNVAMQNRMALDILLAAQGGVCKVINTECCAYVSDATKDILDLVHSTEKGIQELHRQHGFNLGDMTGVFGSWGTGLVKFIFSIVMVLMMVCLIGSCVVFTIKTLIKKTAKTVIQAPKVYANCPGGGEMVCSVVEDEWLPPVL